MITKNNKKEKKSYSKPKIEIVKIDNQITTFMMSFPQDPEALNKTAPNNSPYKI